MSKTLEDWTDELNKELRSDLYNSWDGDYDAWEDSGDSPEVDDLMVEGEELFGDVAQTVYDNIREVLEQECE